MEHSMISHSFFFLFYTSVYFLYIYILRFIYISIQSGATIIERFDTHQVPLSDVSRGGASVVVLRGHSVH